MPRLNKILVPVDFSPRSDLAAAQAVSIAKQFDAQVIFLHVIPILPSEHPVVARGLYTGEGWRDIDKLESALTARMDEFSMAHCSEVRSEQVVLQGDPAKRIVSLAAEQGADLIAMPTHGYGPFRRFLLGSVTSKVLHDAECPVLTGAHVQESAPSDGRIRRMACAVALNEHSETALTYAWELAQAFGSPLSVIHAAPHVEQAMAYGQWYPDQLRKTMVEGAQKRAGELIAKVGCEADVHINDAEAVGYVSSTVAEIGADLLVIGRSEPRGLFGRLRSDAYGLIRESPCAVISV